MQRRPKIERQIGRLGSLMLLLLAAAACSGDDDAADCPEGSDAGMELSCECEDSGTGSQLCRDDGTLGECDCSDEAGGGSGRGGRGGSGGSGSGASGSGGSDASEDGGSTGGTGGSDEDGGADPGSPPDAGMDMDSGSSTDAGSSLPMDGDQLAVCTDDSDCNMDYACYDRGPGQHFCTRTCTSPTDCESIDGASYTCSLDGQCEVVCTPGDDSSCPEGLTCTSVGGPPGPPGFACKYSDFAGEPNAGEAYSQCAGAGDCNGDLDCYGAFGNVPGYCTHACLDSSECTEQPSSGSIEPTCVLTMPILGTEMCMLDCSSDPEGCPDGMICGFGARCAYQ